MSSEEDQKHIYAQGHQLYYYYNDFKGHIFDQKLKISLKSEHLKGFINWLLPQRAKMYFSPLICLF